MVFPEKWYFQGCGRGITATVGNSNRCSEITYVVGKLRVFGLWFNNALQK
jgi:hypothetical protein